MLDKDSEYRLSEIAKDRSLAFKLATHLLIRSGENITPDTPKEIIENRIKAFQGNAKYEHPNGKADAATLNSLALAAHISSYDDLDRLVAEAEKMGPSKEMPVNPFLGVIHRDGQSGAYKDPETRAQIQAMLIKLDDKKMHMGATPSATEDRVNAFLETKGLKGHKLDENVVWYALAEASGAIDSKTWNDLKYVAANRSEWNKFETAHNLEGILLTLQPNDAARKAYLDDSRPDRTRLGLQALHYNVDKPEDMERLETNFRKAYNQYFAGKKMNNQTLPELKEEEGRKAVETAAMLAQFYKGRNYQQLEQAPEQSTAPVVAASSTPAAPTTQPAAAVQKEPAPAAKQVAVGRQPRNTEYDLTFSENNQVGQRYLIALKKHTLGPYGPSGKGDDGKVGELTDPALRAFQNEKKIPITGKFDEKTMEVLGAEYAIANNIDPKKAYEVALKGGPAKEDLLVVSAKEEKARAPGGTDDVALIAVSSRRVPITTTLPGMGGTHAFVQAKAVISSGTTQPLPSPLFQVPTGFSHEAVQAAVRKTRNGSPDCGVECPPSPPPTPAPGKDGQKTLIDRTSGTIRV